MNLRMRREELLKWTNVSINKWMIDLGRQAVECGVMDEIYMRGYNNISLQPFVGLMNILYRYLENLLCARANSGRLPITKPLLCKE